MSSGVSLTSWRKRENASSALVGHPSSDVVTIKLPVLHPIFSLAWLKLNLILLLNQLKLALRGKRFERRWKTFWLSQTWLVTLRLQEQVFCGCAVPFGSKETKLGSSNSDTSPSVGKNDGVVLVPYCGWNNVRTAIYGGVDISEVPECYMLQWGSQKLLQGLVCHEPAAYFSVFDLFLTQSIMAIWLKRCKPNNFESHSSLKLSIINIWGHCLNFDECESFLELSSPDILALCETNLDDSINPGNSSRRDYLPLIWKNSITHRDGLSTGLISRENFADSYLSFWLALLLSVSSFLFLYWSPFWYFCMAFDYVSSNIDEVLVINPSINVFVFGDVNLHHKCYHSFRHRIMSSIIY